MATLNLFPARIQFVDSKGCLTPEAYRALQVVLTRLGGSFGDQGVDTFSDIMGSFASDNQMVAFDSINQPTESSYQTEMIMQGES